MKAQRLQAQFIKKREIEQAKIQQTNGKQSFPWEMRKCYIYDFVYSDTAVHRYYDQWGRITSRHEHWSTPQYYQESEEKLRKRLEQEEKQKMLTERQEKLRVQLAEDTKLLDIELKGRSQKGVSVTQLTNFF